MKISFCTAILASAALLVACSSQPEPVSKPRVVAPKKQYMAQDYIRHMAQAQIAPQDNAADIEVMNAYAAQPSKKSERQTVLVLEYKNNASDMVQRAVAPIGTVKGSDFSDLRELMEQMPGSRYTLQNLSVLSVTLKPEKQLKVEQENTPHAQQQIMLGRAKPLPPVENIRMQMRLIRFFIDNRFRDAAYLATDNLKQAIAELPHETPKDIKTVTALSQEAEALESELRERLPFNL